MSVQKHTPGPWRVGTSNTGKSCVWLDGHAEPKNEMGSDSTWIDCNTEANARLIAAAPELLEFARLVLRGLKVGNFKAMPVINLDDDAEQLDMRSLADIASEIIAKAEGAARQALDAIRALREWINAVPKETALPPMPGIDGDWLDSVDAELREALEQPKQEPVQEPVAWTWDTKNQRDGFLDAHFQFSKPESHSLIMNLRPLYTEPPQRKPMTRYQALKIVAAHPDVMLAIRMTEAAHGIKENK